MFRKVALASVIFVVAAASALPATAGDGSQYWVLRNAQGQCFVSPGPAGPGETMVSGTYGSMANAQWALQRMCR